MPVHKDEARNTWYFAVRYSDIQGNRRQRKKRGFKTKREAATAERQFLNSLNNGVYDTIDWTIADVIDLYITEKSQMVKGSTLKGIIGTLDGKVRPFLGKVPIHTLSNTHMLAFHDYLFNPPAEAKHKSLKLSSAREAHSIFMAMIKYAEKHYNIPKLHHKFTPPKTDEVKTDFGMKCYTYNQVYAMIAKVPEDQIFFRDIMEVLYLTGMRISELLALTYASVDFQMKKLSIHQNLIYGINEINGAEKIYSLKVSTPKTSSSIRKISIPNRVIEILRRRFETDSEFKNFSADWFIFSDEKMVPLQYSTLLRRYRILFEKIGVEKINFHDFRHSHVSLLINGGADALLVKDRLGHATVTTTLDTYAHLFPEKDDALLNFLNQL